MGEGGGGGGGEVEGAVVGLTGEADGVAGPFLKAWGAVVGWVWVEGEGVKLFEGWEELGGG